METILQFEWTVTLRHLIQLGAAFVLAMPIALDREKASRIMGLRTFPLVAIASCGFMLLARTALEGDVEAQARVIQGIITGIGFIGGGAILKKGGDVRGTATAASIWNTGAIGATVALGRYEIAIILSIINFLVLHWLTEMKEEEP